MSNPESRPELTPEDLARSWLGAKGTWIQQQINKAIEVGVEKDKLAELRNQLQSVLHNFGRIRNGDRNRIANYAKYEIRRRAELMDQENSRSSTDNLLT